MSTRFVLTKARASVAAAPLGEYVFNGELMTIGSDATNTIIVAGSASEQAVVVREGELLTLINSADGTILNEQTLRREAIEPLSGGDRIRIGSYVIAVFDENLTSAKNQSVEDLPPTEEREKDSGGEPADESAIEKKPARNFADILNTLRTEEDSFYFIVRNGTGGETARIPLEQAEMPLGFDLRGEIVFAPEQISTLYAIVRKDWSGIVVESRRGGDVSVNDEAVQTTKRLRNGDRVNFQQPRKNGRKEFSLELHEPSSLVALESILETRPENVGRKFIQAAGSSINNPGAAQIKENLPLIERRFFGHFSFFEVASMLIGTLMAAILIFVLLEFMIG